MDIIVAAATQFEIQPFINKLESRDLSTSRNKVDIVITGVGIMESTYSLSLAAAKKPDLIIQAGIAGSFSTELPPGSAVIVKDEIIGDSGATEKGSFKDLFDLSFSTPDQYPYTGKALVNPDTDRWNFLNLPVVSGLTVNQITDDTSRIAILKNKYQCAIESMEGAPLHYTALQNNISFIQIRTISNYVGIRDKKEWKLKEAVVLLNQKLEQILDHLL